jgi:hypothetical protein
LLRQKLHEFVRGQRFFQTGQDGQTDAVRSQREDSRALQIVLQNWAGIVHPDDDVEVSISAVMISIYGDICVWKTGQDGMREQFQIGHLATKVVCADLLQEDYNGQKANSRKKYSNADVLHYTATRHRIDY